MDRLGQPGISNSSAIDLTTSPVASRPSSPSLEPSTSFARRRTSWGTRLDLGQDPLRLDLPPPRPQASTSTIYSSNDDPFFSPVDERPDYSTTRHYGREPFNYSTSQVAPSSASLINEFDMHRDEDELHLTSNISRSPTEERWSELEGDPERIAGQSPRSRRRTVRYSTAQSPLKKTGTAIKSVSNNIRRVSLRVVNLASSGLENQIRLPDDDFDPRNKRPPDDHDDQLPDLSKSLPIRGRTLGCLSPTSRLRLSLYNLLIYPWTEPTILILIIANAVVLTIQASRSLTLPSSDNKPPPVRGYFHFWEDYALFALFIIFTLEAFARICVSGFLFDPDIPFTSVFHTFSSSNHDPVAPSATIPNSASVTRQNSLTSGVHRSFSQRLAAFTDNVSRPFQLSSQPSTVRYLNDPTPVVSNVSVSISQFTETSKHSKQASSLTIREPAPPPRNQTYMSTQSNSDLISLPFRLSINQAHDKVQRNVPYLRHSWSRIDFVAIVSFWISFALATTGLERGANHIGVFRAMSVVRTARLLTITSGTTTIMHSLKTARPLLASVAYFVLFAMVLFSIIGTQAFNGSFRRVCHLSPILGEPEIALDQFCGGQIDPVTLNATGYWSSDGTQIFASKGYICPLGQTCKEDANNPNDNVESFDTIYYAALQVVIVASANGWSPLMYSMIDSEFFVSCFFFILCVIVLNFWLINLFVAVITNTFSAIRKETSKSAFGAATLTALTDEHDDGWSKVDGRKTAKKNIFKAIVDIMHPVWVLLALASLSLQATRTVDISETHEQAMYFGELAITVAFDLEIVLRFLATLPQWRSFFSSGNNWLDLVLAVGSSIIQIPFIQESAAYPWFTIFQLARFYRVILVVPRMKPLLLAVFGNMYGLANMSLFLLLVNYIAALVAIQLLRGDVSSDQQMNFGQIFSAFLAVYQVFSSENWTDILYGASSAETHLGQTFIVVIFISGWMLFANFIVLQMFIAVINENFDVAEEAKKGQQATNYWQTHQTESASSTWMRHLNPYRWVKANPVKVKVENLPSNLVLPMQKSLVQDYGPRSSRSVTAERSTPSTPRHYHTKSLTMLQRLFAGKAESDDVPMTSLRHVRAETTGEQDEETERHLDLLATVNHETGVATVDEINDTLYERRAQKADFIRDHPSYDKTFWLFSQKNHLRKWCQKIVRPSNGERIFGTAPSPFGHPIFQLVIFLAVAGGIAVESVATPAYRRNYFAENGRFRGAWFDVAETVFGLTLVVEFLIKIVADGFIFTPNAYVRSIWNVLDFIIMVGLLVNVTTSLIFIGGLSRLTRSLKALRALRLITLMDIMRSTFKSLIISGASRIIDAGILAILYMIPYAVWGLNIFSGKMNQCNDGNVSGASECIGQYTNTVIDGKFGFLAPRVWENPAPSTVFSFDTFRASLLILFEIVSLEGWIDVMNVATSIIGKDQQPVTNASQVNAIFFLIYNLLGGVVILTLFVSIIIGNFSSKTGSAFLTKPQREWIDLQKLFKRQRPSKRPVSRPSGAIRSWCFDRAVHKHGFWSRAMTVFFFLHIIALMTQTVYRHALIETIRGYFFLAVTVVYILDVLVRFSGLGYRSFKANGWNLFDVVVAGGSFGTTILVTFSKAGADSYELQQLQKLFLVSIAFKLVQRTNNLNKLFKTAMASLPVIVSLLGLWLILFLFFAILFVEVFGMTKWGSGETRNMNYSTIGTAMVMLAFMSTGEGWNQYMHDYAVVYPRCTNASGTELESDCGSIGWAFTLFIAWNLLSMYIFVNMFTGVVVENFSYVFQTSGGGAKSITREEMRSFKKIWSEFANPKTGLLDRSRFVKFFGRLNGVFEVRIYPVEYQIPNITAAVRADPSDEFTSPYTPRSRVLGGVDVVKLDQILSSIDYAAVRRRRATYIRLLNEANLISGKDKAGMSFTAMLMLLAHHKLIVDREALNLKDLVARTEINKIVTDLVNLDRVKSLLSTISCRRRFLAKQARNRAAMYEANDIPHIVVDAMPLTPPVSSRDISSAGYESSMSTPSSPTPDRRFHSPDVSLALDHRGPGLSRSSRRGSEVSMLSIDLGHKSPRESVAEEDPQNVLSSIQNSMWGDMMFEAMEEVRRTDG
ncbi:Ion transport protein-domain-containing protein [Mycena floridula]|nr:Ion transport protein-domain-containing protein [Mycena floridula]